MATTLAYVLEDRRTSRQAHIVADFRSSERIQRLFVRGQRALDEARIARRQNDGGDQILPACEATDCFR